MRISDFKNVFKTQELEIKSVKNVSDDNFVIDFNIDKNLLWIPGEHGIFTIKNKEIKGKKWRAFSISSIPQDGVISIATKISDNPSSFKSVLKSMQEGDKIKIRGPFGWYKIQPNENAAVFIASGVGITPSMSLLKEHDRIDSKTNIHLIYNSKNSHLYKDEISKIADANENIKVSFINDLEEFNIAIQNSAKENGPAANYYLSGTPQMIKSVKENIKSFDIPKKQMIADPFMGY